MRRSRGSRGKKLGEQSPPPRPHVLVPKNPLKDVFDNTFDIGDFRAHIFCPQTTQEPAEKHLVKQDRLVNCLLIQCHKSITDTLDTVKIEKRFACANEQRKIKGHFGTSEGSMRIAEWKMSPFPPPSPLTFQNAPPPLARNALLHKTLRFVICVVSLTSLILTQRKIPSKLLHMRSNLQPGQVGQDGGMLVANFKKPLSIA